MKGKLVEVILILFFLNLVETVVPAPGFPGLVEYKQPDGTRINIYIKGDEHINWVETTDGYTLLSNDRGGYEYAFRGKNNLLEPSGCLAHNIPDRNAKDLLLLSGIPKGLRYSAEQISILRSLNDIYINNIQSEAAFPTVGSRKLVCILMGFKDLAFSKTQADFNNLFNQIQYSTDGATGSVRDYFREVSYNQLDLNVTLAGPYTAANHMSYYGKQSGTVSDVNPWALITEAVNLADPDVNYAEFDNDNNGSVDGVYVIFAGYGQEAGASTDAIWSHSSSISTVYKDGKSISKYACSPELRGNTGSGLTRIGVICHEFGHVLGSPDFYDTDYETGGSFEGTKTWDLMASGSWNNAGSTPAHPNGFIKVVCYNWATATVLVSASTITLNNAEEFTNSFFKINTTTTGEYFFLENREKHLFDTYIPGSGLIIYHVHRDVISSGNSINTTHPQKMYPVSQNAATEPNSTPSSYGSIGSASCAWTGTGKNEFSDTSVPGSKSWAGVNTGKPVTNISRDAVNKTVTFAFNQPVSIPSPPVATSATDITQDSFSAHWTSSPGASGFYLDVSTSSAFLDFVSGYENRNAGNSSTFSVTGLSGGTTVYYRVRAYNSAGTSGNSNVVAAKTIPSAPVASTVTNITRTSFMANWNSSSGSTGYFLDVSMDNTFLNLLPAFSNLYVGNVTAYGVNGLTSCNTYYYRVRAANENGQGPNSNTITVKTACANTAVLTIGEAGGSTGSIVCVPVSANGLSDAVGFQFTLAFDPAKLTYQGCTSWGGGCNGAAIQITPLSGGKVTFVYNDAPVNLDNGKFFEICFTVNAGASGSVPIFWSDIPTLREFSDSEAEAIPCTYTDGAVVVNVGWTLSGVLTYPHYSTQTLTTLPHVPILLMNSGDAGRDTSLTDESGRFSFPELQNNNYTLKPDMTLPWGGVTAMDLTSYKKHIGGAVVLEPIQVRSGDVNGSGALTSMDMTFIKQRIGAMISSFPVGDYAYYPSSVAINSADLVRDIQVLCYGDANGSYAIDGGTKMVSGVLSEDSRAVCNFQDNGEIEVPFRVNRAVKNLSSVTLMINYPSDHFEVENVLMTAHDEDLSYWVKDGIIRVVYSTLRPLDLEEGDLLMTMYLKPKINPDGDFPGQIRMKFTGRGEFGDFNDHVLKEVILFYPGLPFNARTGLTEIPGILVYPNPAQETLFIKNAKDAEVILSDSSGKILLKMNAAVDPVKMDISNLVAGPYILQVKHQNEIQYWKIAVIR